MKTIKGYNTNIQEGILSSTKSGKSSTIDDFLKTTFYNERWYEKVQNEIDVYNIKYDYDFTKIDMIPFWIKECKSLKFDNCRFSEYVLPEVADVLTFNNCTNLTKIKTSKKAATTTISELILKGCGDIDFTELKNLNIKRLKLIDCDITTLKGLDGISYELVVKNCHKLKEFDYECNTTKRIALYAIKPKSFNPLYATDVVLHALYGNKTIDINIGQVEDLVVENCSQVLNLVISGNSVDTLVVRECNKLESIKTTDCTSSLSLVDLPSIENYELPPRITGACIFDEVKTIPEVNCKKKIIR